MMMTIYLLNSDARQIPLSDQSVQCIITSPPYYGLRDYGTAQWDGGDPMCDHRIDRFGNRKITDATTIDQSKQTSLAGEFVAVGQSCPRCGATRIDKQIGLERTPQEYVASIVAVMRECWRVLKDDGVLWLNLGDSYASQGGERTYGSYDGETGRGDAVGKRINGNGLKPKDLIGIPWRCAFALQDDGWYLRSDIIWSKPNPMPESVTDRPTKAHEYIFLLTKRARYYYDAAAIQESGSIESARRLERGVSDNHKNINGAPGQTPHSMNQPRPNTRNGNNEYDVSPRNRRSVWTVATTPYSGAHFATFPPKLIEPMVLAGTSQRGECPKCGKAWGRVVERKRLTHPELSPDDPRYRPNTYNGSYKDINGMGDAGYTEVTTLGWLPGCSCYGYSIPQYPDMPEDVTPPNLCDKCEGTGVIVFDDLFGRQEQSCRFCNGTGGDHPSPEWIEYQAEVDAVQSERKTLLDNIDQNSVTIPQTILDPFAGTATVGRVAIKHQRRFVGLDLNLKYIGDLAKERTSKVQTYMQFATEP